MIDLGATDFYFGVPNLLRPQFEEYSAQLFDEWEEHVGQTLLLPDYSLALEVEEGSVKGIGKVGAWLAAIYIGVGQYGDFVQGLQTIRAQVSSVGDFLAERAAITFELTDSEMTVRKRSGSLGRLQRLLVKLQCREMTAEQAMREAETLFGEEALTSPEFMQSLKNSLEQMPLNAEQLSLSLNTPEFEPEVLGSEKQRRPRPSRPMPSAPPLQQLRVEVWRESKKGSAKFELPRVSAFVESSHPRSRDPHREAIKHRFDGSPLIGPEKRRKKAIRTKNCLSDSEFFSFRFFLSIAGSGQSSGSPSLGYLSWRSKKGDCPAA